MAETNTFLASPLCFPVWLWTEALLRRAKAEERKAERKGETWELSSAVEVSHCDIKTVWVSSLPSTDGL